MVVSKSGPRKLRVGAVSYLNTKPLIYRFDEWARDAELVLDLPSRLADRLARSDLDVALVPGDRVFSEHGVHDCFRRLHCLPRPRVEREVAESRADQ